MNSDILAELDWPASGISRFEDTMPFPSFAGAEDSEVIEGQYYYAQTGLRKLLNRAHKYLYKSKSKGKALAFDCSICQAVSSRSADP